MTTIIEASKHELLVITVFLIILNIIFLIFYKKIAIFLNLFDNNKFTRYFNSNGTPVLGGLLFLINIFLFLLLLLLFDHNLLDLKELGIKTTLITLLGFILIFFIGLLDDKYNIGHNLKIFLFLFISYLPIAAGESFLISKLSFSFLSKEILLDKLSILFTLVAIFTFINIFNMYDGVNGQSGIYTLIISIYLILTNPANLFFIPLVTFSVFFLLLNFRGKIFLGNSGSYAIAYFLSLMIIWSYNKNPGLKAESVYLLMSFPFLDMIRLFISRIYNGRSPFVADSNHFHHIVLRKFKNNIFLVNFNSLIQVGLPLLIYYILELKFLAIFLSIFLYFLFLFILNKK